jgi:hypothetical protein
MRFRQADCTGLRDVTGVPRVDTLKRRDEGGDNCNR